MKLLQFLINIVIFLASLFSLFLIGVAMYVIITKIFPLIGW